jgi:[acyl-carrier-protein] S-malonyltransferase
MNSIGFVFPGQASQYPGMGREFYEHFVEARQVFEAADTALDFPLSELCFNGPAEKLKLTENTQPAILTVSVAVYRVLAAKGIRPHFVAGHSLGEYSALVAAGSMGLAEAVQAVRNRGRYMQEAVPVGDGGMAAILGLALPQVEALCVEAAQGEVLAAANLNSPTQIVIAGTAAAVQRAVNVAPARGAKKAVILPVSAPFHCALMRPAQERLKKDLESIHFQDLAIPLVNNVDAAPITAGTAVCDSLIRQVCSPVQWSDSMQLLIQQGVRLFVEVGPGRVLSGLARQIDKSIKLANVEDEKSLKDALELIAQFA